MSRCVGLLTHVPGYSKEQFDAAIARSLVVIEQEREFRSKIARDGKTNSRPVLMCEPGTMKVIVRFDSFADAARYYKVHLKAEKSASLLNRVVVTNTRALLNGEVLDRELVGYIWVYDTKS